MPLLFVDSYKKVYQASPFALSTCLTFLLGIFVILMPIFAGYATDDFWDYLQVYYDQPIVGLVPTNFIIYGSNSQNGKFYSSQSYCKYLNDGNGNDLCTVCDSGTCGKDSGGDGILIYPKEEEKEIKITKKDSLEISFTIKEEFTNIKFMAFLDYGINSKIKFLMHTLLYLDLDIEENRSYIQTKGELVLKQRAPFTSTTITNKQYYNDNYVLDPNKINFLDFSAIFEEFKSRNFTTEYKHRVISSSRSGGGISVNIKINIPKAQKILYHQKTYNNLKKAWIQYIYIFIPIFLVVYYLLSFILTNQVFPCSMKSDLGRF